MQNTIETDAGRYRAEWKGERGEPVRALQFGLGFRARQTLRSMLFAMADSGGGPRADAIGHFRALRTIAAAGPEGTAHHTIREMLGRESWCVSCRDLVIPEVIVTIGRVADHADAALAGSRLYGLHPRIAMQARRLLATIEAEWTPVRQRRWEAGELVVVRDGGDAERAPMRDVVAREFERSEAVVGRDHDRVWSSIVSLAGSGTAQGLMHAAARRLVAAGLIAPMDDVMAAADGDGTQTATLALDDDHRQRLSEVVAAIDPFRDAGGAAAG